MNIKYLSIGALALSGLLITLVSAFFSIKGFVLFLPDPELYYGLLGLGIAFELAKITASTFLFHKMKDGKFPLLFKTILTTSVLALILFSAIFTFVHLNASASKSLSVTGLGNTQVVQLQDRNKIIETRIANINTELAAMPTDMPSAKIRLYNVLNPEKEKLQGELNTNLMEVSKLQNTTNESDQYIFLNNLSVFTGVSREHIFNDVTLFIVCVIDPLAISLFLCATYILASRRNEDNSKDESLIVDSPSNNSFHELGDMIQKIVDRPIKTDTSELINADNDELSKLKASDYIDKDIEFWEGIREQRNLQNVVDDKNSSVIVDQQYTFEPVQYDIPKVTQPKIITTKDLPNEIKIEEAPNPYNIEMGLPIDQNADSKYDEELDKELSNLDTIDLEPPKFEHRTITLSKIK